MFFTNLPIKTIRQNSALGFIENQKRGSVPLREISCEMQIQNLAIDVMFVANNDNLTTGKILEIPITSRAMRVRISDELLAGKEPADMFRIEIPVNIHARCLAHSDDKSPDYALLRNGVILGDDPHNIMVHIRCDAAKARAIMTILAEKCPELSDECHIYTEPT